jgi:hypothetical protein
MEIKRTIAILLAVCFLVSVTATAVSAPGSIGNWELTDAQEHVWGVGSSNSGGNDWDDYVNGHINRERDGKITNMIAITVIL